MSLPYLRSSSEFEAVIAGEAHELEQRRTVHTPLDQQIAMASEPLQQPVVATPPMTETRVAMLPTSAAESRTVDMTPTERPKPARGVQTVSPPAGVSADRAVIVEETVAVPMPVVIREPPAAAVPVNLPDDRDADREAELAALDAEMNTALTTRPAEKPGAYFDSTGHLAMIPVPTAAPSIKKPDKRRRQAGTKPTAAAPVEIASGPGAMSGMSASGSWPTGETDDGFGINAAVPLEDVILQQPLENRRVNRVENVVAMTRAKGWPIALVRSDLPDDFWWVQQMVGIRGNAFAARANFGNENSIPGSVYHMVIVFLDSPDEVRRFRIAKRFKDLPEGSRHSREFTFVRQ